MKSSVMTSSQEFLFSQPLWLRVDQEKKDICAQFMGEVPVKVGAMARALGLRVLSSTLDLGISGEIRPSDDAEAGFVIRINRHEVKHRQRFTLAHEIAHYLLHSERIEHGIVDNVMYRSKLPNRLETEANKLAADIIMPRPIIRQWLQNNFSIGYSSNNLPEIAKAWRVSEEAASIRLGLR